MEKAQAITAVSSPALITAAVAAPVAATVELVPEATIIPLEERLRTVRRRRQLEALRTWGAPIAISGVAALLVAIALVAFISR